MTEDVIITLQGFQQDETEEGGEPVEVVTPGKYYRRNGQHYLFFEEAMEGFPEKTRNIFKFSDRRLLVHRKGLINAEMLFEADRRTITSYESPMGRMQIGIAATGFSLEEEEHRISYGVDYSMNINDGYAADCHIALSIQPRGSWSISGMQ